MQAEWEDKQNKRLERYLKSARFRYQASVEQIHFSASRNLDKNMFLRLSDCSFIDRKENVLITGPTSVAKASLPLLLGIKTVKKNTRLFTTILKNCF